MMKVRLDTKGKSYPYKGTVKTIGAKNCVVTINGRDHSVSLKDVWKMKKPQTYKKTKGEVLPAHRAFGTLRSNPELRRLTGLVKGLAHQPTIERIGTPTFLFKTSTFLTVGKGSVVNFKGIKPENAATVNAINEGGQGGGGVDGAFVVAGGDALAIARRNIPTIEGSSWKRCATGNAFITISGDLHMQYKHIIHAVGPNFSIVNNDSVGKCMLLNAIKRSMHLAKEAGVKELAFCIVSGGIFRAHLPLSEIVKIIVVGMKAFSYIGLKEVMLTGFTFTEVDVITDAIACFKNLQSTKDFIHSQDKRFVDLLVEEDKFYFNF